MPTRLQEPTYAAHVELCRVRSDGSVEWAGIIFRLAHALGWRAQYGPIASGTLDHRGRFWATR